MNVGATDMTIQKRTLTVLVGIAAVAVVVAGLYGWPQRPRREAELTGPALAASSLSSRGNQQRKTQDAVPEKNVTGKPVAGNSTSVPYKESFAAARNYWTYGHQILPAAQAGDPDPWTEQRTPVRPRTTSRVRGGTHR